MSNIRSTPLPTSPCISLRKRMWLQWPAMLSESRTDSMSYATSDENIKEAMKRIKEACEKLK